MAGRQEWEVLGQLSAGKTGRVGADGVSFSQSSSWYFVELIAASSPQMRFAVIGNKLHIFLTNLKNQIRKTGETVL